MPTTAAPDIERTFGLLHESTALVVFVVPGIVALVLDPIVFLLADRYPRRWFIAGGLGAMAATSFGAALAPDPTTLAIVFAVWFVAAGASASLAQGTLVDRAPDQRARTMARWSLASTIGDLLAPLVLAVLAGLGFGWRAAFVVVGCMLAIWAAAIALRPFDDARSRDDDEPTLWQGFRAALRDRVLILWLFGMALCDLLDEILVVFASLHVRHELGAGPTWQAVIVGAMMIGSTAGLVILDRLLARYSERTLLIAAGLGCTVAYAAWLAAPVLWLSALLMLPVGATASALYPLVAARAYERAPGRSGVVLAASHMFVPLGLALPWVLGRVADAAGTYVALALLVIQPLALVLLTVTSACRREC